MEMTCVENDDNWNGKNIKFKERRKKNSDMFSFCWKSFKLIRKIFLYVFGGVFYYIGKS